jgi:CHAT domain-containing protein
MASFYTHLGQLGDSAVALQKAMTELRRRYPHPYYWAPFVLVGTTQSWN